MSRKVLQCSGREKMGKIIEKKNALVVLLLVCIAMISFAVGGKETINLNEYIVTEFSGYDGYGAARIKFDRNSFLSDYMNDVRFQSKQAEDLFRQTYGNSADSPVAALQVYLMVQSGTSDLAKLSKEHELQNGEKVFVKWDLNEDEIEKFFKCNLNYADEELVVEGLVEPTTFDPFENLKIVFGGNPGEGVGMIEDGWYTVSNALYGEYHIEPERGLWDGDSVTVTYEVSEDEIARCGFAPSRTSMDVLVDGIDYYAKNIEEACNEFEGQRKEQEALQEAYMYAYHQTSNDTKCELVQYYYLIPANERNNHYLFSAIKVEFTRENQPSFYYVVGKENIVVDGSGRGYPAYHPLEENIRLDHEVTRTFGSYLGDNPTRELSGFNTLDELREYLTEAYYGYRVEEKAVNIRMSE